MACGKRSNDDHGLPVHQKMVQACASGAFIHVASVYEWVRVLWKYGWKAPSVANERSGAVALQSCARAVVGQSQNIELPPAAAIETDGTVMVATAETMKCTCYYGRLLLALSAPLPLPWQSLSLCRRGSFLFRSGYPAFHVAPHLHQHQSRHRVLWYMALPTVAIIWMHFNSIPIIGGSVSELELKKMHNFHSLSLTKQNKFYAVSQHVCCGFPSP